MKINDIVKFSTLVKGSQSQGLMSSLLVSGLALILSVSPTSAKNSQIESIYFNTDHSIVIETATQSELEFLQVQSRGDVQVIQILDTKLSHRVEPKISSKDFDVEVNKHKATVELTLKAKSGNTSAVTSKAILNGLAYELEFNAPVAEASQWKAVTTKPNSIDSEVKLEDSKLKTEELHQLAVEASDHKVYAITNKKTEIDQFLEKLDDGVAASIEADQEFHETTFRNIDSASLTHLADTLVEKGYSEEALAAYRRALELNAENINAKLGLAEVTSDENEKLANYLASINDKALLEIGSHWFEQGYQAHDLKSVAKALVSFQFAVLKNPKNAEYRYLYAQVLERSGADFWSQATKRYLEAAALAKLEYLAGNKTIEPLLRNSTESLIRVLSIQGDFDNAAKYCAAYMNLGFKKFIDGKAVLSILKEVEANRNPFQSKLTQNIINNKEPSA